MSGVFWDFSIGHIATGKLNKAQLTMTQTISNGIWTLVRQGQETSEELLRGFVFGVVSNNDNPDCAAE